MSATVSSFGITASPTAVKRDGTGEGARGADPETSGMDSRPPWFSWMAILAPAACTASASRRMPGM